MKKLVIDIGNSQIKSALYEDDRLLASPVFYFKEAAVGAWQMPKQKLSLVFGFGTFRTHLGDATNACLQVGFWSTVWFEMERLFAAYHENFLEISVYLRGVYAESFDSFAKDHIFVVPNLVLLGLNCILNHHVA